MTEVTRKFENIKDPFNPNNYLTGYITISQGDSYGQLLLTHINGMKCKEQIIYSTPKMYYPFSKLGNFYFKFLDKPAPVYEKYDGTNIISYKYIYRGKTYFTYKTRLSPILAEGKYGNFYSMWCEILKKYPNIIKASKEYDINFSYELYGVVNKHLILYPVRLDTKLLFGLDKSTGMIILPDEFKDLLPVVEKDCEIQPNYFFPDFYKKMRGEIEATNDYSNLEEVKGSEGRVIYIKEEGQWKQWKLKPETIFKVHTKPGINKNDIKVTCYNALENVELDNLTYEYVCELLNEEFEMNEILANENRIKTILKEVKEEIKKRHFIIQIYNKLGLTLTKNRNELMRKMSKNFEKKDMRYVYNIIEAYEKG